MSDDSREADNGDPFLRCRKEMRKSVFGVYDKPSRDNGMMRI